MNRFVHKKAFYGAQAQCVTEKGTAGRKKRYFTPREFRRDKSDLFITHSKTRCKIILMVKVDKKYFKILIFYFAFTLKWAGVFSFQQQGHLSVPHLKRPLPPAPPC
ncbi:MAG: hypothetical protein RL386_328 [Bacteroidota bacterium]